MNNCYNFGVGGQRVEFDEYDNYEAYAGEHAHHRIACDRCGLDALDRLDQVIDHEEHSETMRKSAQLAQGMIAEGAEQQHPPCNSQQSSNDLKQKLLHLGWSITALGYGHYSYISPDRKHVFTNKKAAWKYQEGLRGPERQPQVRFKNAPKSWDWSKFKNAPFVDLNACVNHGALAPVMNAAVRFGRGINYISLFSGLESCGQALLKLQIPWNLLVSFEPGTCPVDIGMCR